VADNIKKLNVTEALEFLKKGLEAKVAWYEKEFSDLKKAEADLIAKKKAKLKKDGGMDAPDLAMSADAKLNKLKKDVWINPKEANNPKERLKVIGPGLKTSLPEDEGMRDDGNDEGSGGLVLPNNSVKSLKKRALECSMKKAFSPKPDHVYDEKTVHDSKLLSSQILHPAPNWKTPRNLKDKRSKVKKGEIVGKIGNPGGAKLQPTNIGNVHDKDTNDLSMKRFDNSHKPGGKHHVDMSIKKDEPELSKAFSPSSKTDKANYLKPKHPLGGGRLDSTVTAPRSVQGHQLKLDHKDVSTSMKKAGLNPDKLAQRLQGLADKAVRAKAEAPNAKESDVKQHQTRMHAKMGMGSSILGQGKINKKPEPQGKVAKLKARAHEAMKPALPHVSYGSSPTGTLGSQASGPGTRDTSHLTADKMAHVVVKAALGMDPGGAPKKKSKLAVMGTTMPNLASPGMGKKMPGISNPGGTVAGAGVKKTDPELSKAVPTKQKELSEAYRTHSASNKMPNVEAGKAAMALHHYHSEALQGGHGNSYGDKDAYHDKKQKEWHKIAQTHVPDPNLLKACMLEKVSPPGREEQVKELKGKVANPWATAWASYDKSKKDKEMKKAGLPGDKQKLPDLSNFKSLVGSKPKPASPVAGINKELNSFKSVVKKAGPDLAAVSVNKELSGMKSLVPKKPAPSKDKTLPLPGVRKDEPTGLGSTSQGSIISPTGVRSPLSAVDLGGGPSPQAPAAPLGSATAAPKAPKTGLGGVGRV
jgi:hypothetical protein